MNQPLIEIRSAPHVQGPKSVETIMRHVVYSLLPICAFYVFQYGISALASIVVVTAACLFAERYFVRTGTQAGRLSDYSAVITGLLLALTLPPGFPLWMGAVAGLVAIALGKALFGGIGIIHKNNSIAEQADAVVRVKRFENGFIENPMTVSPSDTIGRVVQIRQEYGYKKVPVVDERGVLVGIISDVDYFATEDNHVTVASRMQPRSDMVVGSVGLSLSQANDMIQHLSQ